jgi:hypothetical protein
MPPAPPAAQNGPTRPQSTPAQDRSQPASVPEPLPADFEGTSGTVVRDGAGKPVATLRDVRVAEHQGFDRVVFEFEEETIPGYHVEYVDKPVRACGSGEPVALAGDAWLEIRIQPARAHDDEGRPTIAERDRMPGLRIVRQLRATCDFEADVTWVLGVASPNRYRVLELRSPARLVVDVKH